MTPAIETLEALGCQFTLHLYATGDGGGYGINAAEKLALEPEQVFKSLVVSIEGHNPVIALVPVSRQLNMKKLAKAAGAKSASMMSPDEAERTTGYVIGGICPIGLKRPFTIIADESIRLFGNVFISGGKRGVELELSTSDLLKITEAETCQIAD